MNGGVCPDAFVVSRRPHKFVRNGDLRCPIIDGKECPFAPRTPQDDAMNQVLPAHGQMMRIFYRKSIQTKILEAFQEQGWPERVTRDLSGSESKQLRVVLILGGLG